jgi:hypothetical protein
MPLKAAVLLVAFLAACGGSDAETAETPAPPPPAVETAPVPLPAPETSASPPVDPKQLEATVRAWSAALNAGDDEAAADLFAPGALVIQGGLGVALETYEAAVTFNAGLPCSGEIVSLSTEGDVVTAVFVLGDRPTSKCDAPPGTRAAAQFLIKGGKIAVWQQIPPPEETSPSDADASAAEQPA